MASLAEVGVQDQSEQSFDPNQPLRIIGHTEDGEPVYDTNGLRGLISAYADGLAGKDLSTRYAHGYVLSVDDRIRGILDEHRRLHPETSEAAIGFCREFAAAEARLRDFEGSLEDYRLTHPDEERRFQRERLFSKFYIELEPIALRLAPGENPRRLCL